MNVPPLPRHTLDSCHSITGTAVVIDVIRAFSTAAYAFTAGAKEIILTDTVESAFELREKRPGAFLAGEVRGYPIPGFDLSNSPIEVAHAPISGRTLIQRTSAGTQGVVRSRQASALYVASFCCATATARLLAKNSSDISFVVTGGDEDAACADYLEELLQGRQPSWPEYERRVRQSPYARKFTDSGGNAFPATDIDACVRLDYVPFAMRVVWEESLAILRPYMLEESSQRPLPRL